MKGWFVPYRIVNVSCIIFIALRILAHLFGYDSNVILHVVMAVCVATQIMRNVWNSEQKRELTLEMIRPGTLKVTAIQYGTDIFDSLGGGAPAPSALPVPWCAYIPLAHITWVEHGVRGTVLHLNDGSHIPGKASQEHVQRLADAMK